VYSVHHWIHSLRVYRFVTSSFNSDRSHEFRQIGHKIKNERIYNLLLEICLIRKSCQDELWWMSLLLNAFLNWWFSSSFLIILSLLFLYKETKFIIIYVGALVQNFWISVHSLNFVLGHNVPMTSGQYKNLFAGQINLIADFF
jgi:hypothetical protein